MAPNDVWVNQLQRLSQPIALSFYRLKGKTKVGKPPHSLPDSRPRNTKLIA
jgi:hypothetical protein